MDQKFTASQSRYAVNGTNPIYYNDPQGDFKTWFGAFLYKIYDGGKIAKDAQSGRYFVSKQSEVYGSELGFYISYQKRFGWDGESKPPLGVDSVYVAPVANLLICETRTQRLPTKHPQ